MHLMYLFSFPQKSQRSAPAPELPDRKYWTQAKDIAKNVVTYTSAQFIQRYMDRKRPKSEHY